MSIKKSFLKKVIPAESAFKQFANLEKSIYIDIPEDNEDSGNLPNFYEIPFDDFFCHFTTPLDEEWEQKHNLKNMKNLLRVWVEGDMVYCSKWLFMVKLQQYLYLTTYRFPRNALNHKDMELVHFHKIGSNQDPEYLEGGINEWCLVTEALNVMQEFEMTVVDNPTKSFSLRKLNPVVRETFISYTLDLTKPKARSSNPLGGTHASPREHVRRGHKRVYRDGKIVFVKQTTVNKDSPYGKVEKEYIFKH